MNEYEIIDAMASGIMPLNGDQASEADLTLLRSWARAGFPATRGGDDPKDSATGSDSGDNLVASDQIGPGGDPWGTPSSEILGHQQLPYLSSTARSTGLTALL